MSKDYVLNDLATRIFGLETLLDLLIEADAAPSGNAPPPEPARLVVQRVQLSSPLEVWVGVAFASTSAAVLLADRIVNVVRNMSALRVDLPRDRYEAEKYRHAHTVLQREIGNPEAMVVGPADALADLELVAIEGQDVAQQVVIVEQYDDSTDAAELRRLWREQTKVVSETRARLRALLPRSAGWTELRRVLREQTQALDETRQRLRELLPGVEDE